MRASCCQWWAKPEAASARRRIEFIPAPTEPPDFAKNAASAASSDLQRTAALPMNPGAPAAKSAPDASASSSSVEFSILRMRMKPSGGPCGEIETPRAAPPVPVTSTPATPWLRRHYHSATKVAVPSPDPPIDTYLLVREAQVQPAWEFKGHVDPPTFADAMQHALGEGNSNSVPPAAEPRKKRSGFWGFWRRIF